MLKKVSFNPSQVQFTQAGSEGHCTGNFKFQSLTGSIHTQR